MVIPLGIGEAAEATVRNANGQAYIARSDVGLPFAPELEIADSPVRPSEYDHAEAVKRWLALPEPPNAIMVQYDRYVAPVLRALEAHGLRVPEDMAVTGFDDAPDAQWLGGGLTTVHQHFAQMGQLAVRNFIRLIENGPVEDCRHIVPTELIVRATTSTSRTGSSPSRA